MASSRIILFILLLGVVLGAGATAGATYWYFSSRHSPDQLSERGEQLEVKEAELTQKVEAKKKQFEQEVSEINNAIKNNRYNISLTNGVLSWQRDKLPE